MDRNVKLSLSNRAPSAEGINQGFSFNMKLFAVLVAVVGFAGADVSHLPKKYLPPIEDDSQQEFDFVTSPAPFYVVPDTQQMSSFIPKDPAAKPGASYIPPDVAPKYNPTKPISKPASSYIFPPATTVYNAPTPSTLLKPTLSYVKPATVSNSKPSSSYIPPKPAQAYNTPSPLRASYVPPAPAHNTPIPGSISNPISSYEPPESSLHYNAPTPASNSKPYSSYIPPLIEKSDVSTKHPVHVTESHYIPPLEQDPEAVREEGYIYKTVKRLKFKH